MVQTVTNEETGEEKQRLINKTRFKGFGAIAIDFDDKGPVGRPAYRRSSRFSEQPTL